MTNVIEFPAGPAFNLRQIEDRLGELERTSGPECVDCARKGVRRIWEAHATRRPEVKIDVPEGLDETVRALALEVNAKLKAAYDSHMQEMLHDLCRAEIELCKLRFS